MFKKRFIALCTLCCLVLSVSPALASRAIWGFIKDLDGQPVKGLRVLAFDHDGLPYGADSHNDFLREDEHDFMGAAVTDANGFYRINYFPPNRFASGAGHWDDFDHNIVQWRPDIYISVFAPNDTFCKNPDLGWNCSWRYVHSSEVSMNHHTKDDKVINLTVPEFFDTSCDNFEPIRDYMDDKKATELRGIVDMHTHLMAHLGFGAKLIHGAPDACAMMLPGQSFCGTDLYYPPGIQNALPHCDPSHDVWHPTNTCGNYTRFGAIRIMEDQEGARSDHGDGFPAFEGWPANNDVTHQKMWVDWIHRAYRGGLRVMVALAVHSQTLAEIVDGTGPLDDVTAGDRQIEEIKAMAARHHFMEIAYSSEQLRDIVKKGKMAIIIGVELDDLGNLSSDPYLAPDEIIAEINRLYNKGVRYVFPVHLVDNAFSGTALYKDLFAVANYNQTGSWWDMDPNCGDVTYRFDLPGEIEPLLEILGLADGFQPVPSCGPGHVNNKGLTWQGAVAIKEMMRLGMMIDIDHMSAKAVDQTLALLNGEYPVNSGHNGLGRGSENSRTPEQYAQIRDSGGMVGVGWADSNAGSFRNSLRAVSNAMGGQNIALGTDTNGMSKSPGSFNYKPVDYNRIPISRTGTRKWNYNTEGVAHYGLMADFMVHLENLSKDDPNRSYRDDLEQLYRGAENFANMWELCENYNHDDTQEMKCNGSYDANCHQPVYMLTSMDGRLKYYTNSKEVVGIFLQSGHWRYDFSTPNGEVKFYTLKEPQDGALPVFMCRTANWEVTFLSNNLHCDGNIRDAQLGYVAPTQGAFGSNRRLYYMFNPGAGCQYMATTWAEVEALSRGGFTWYQHVNWYAWTRD